MKRIAAWALYGVGALAIAYLALYAYAALTGRDLQPGDPIHIFRKPDAPSYSWMSSCPGRGAALSRCSAGPGPMAVMMTGKKLGPGSAAHR